MEQWLATLPKGIVAIGAILVGTLLIILFDPPRTVCDTQFEVFRDAQKHFLYSVESKGFTRKPEISKQLDLCRSANGPGGCLELFMGLRKMAADLENIPNRCVGDAGSLSEVGRGLWGGLDLIVRLAWGAQEPPSYSERNGWLNAADIALFCQLQAQATRMYGEERWATFRDRMMDDLPRKIELSREQIWQRSIFSNPCRHYQ